MNIREIKALAAVLTQMDLTVLDYTKGEDHIRLERNAARPAAQAQADCAPAAAPEPREEKNDFNNLCEVKAPMVGVFYAASSPESKPLVRVGDTVEKGQVVCLIETMKLMNDITAPVSGQVVDVCVQDGAVLEYGQTIMKIM
jgi:acetyl-CoA carboxylase biotin carboxyl carrier protein